MSGIVGSLGSKSHTVGTYNGGTLGAGVGLSALVGTITPFGATAIPDGWLAADGSAVSRTTYALLFAVISTTWGVGDGSTTFNVPDCDAAFLRGTGTSAGFSHNPTISLVTKLSDMNVSHKHETSIGGINASWVAEYCVVHTNCYSNSPPTGANSHITQGQRDSRHGSESRPNAIGVNYIIKYI